MKRDVDATFGELRPPRAPETLERRVLEAAEQALDDPLLPTLWDRLWTSTALRAAWALSTSALIVAHVVLSLPVDGRRTTGGEATAAEAAVPEDLREIFRLPQLEISPRAARLCLGPPRRPSVDVDDEQTKDMEDAS